MKKLITIFLSVIALGVIAQPTTLIKYSQLQPAFNNNTTFLGSTDNRSLLIKTNGVERIKVDSTGYLRFTSSNFPATGEPNEFNNIVTNSVTTNNYLVRSTLTHSSSLTNTSARIGAILGATFLSAGTTPTLGWAVGVYGSSTVLGGGSIGRVVGGYFIANSRGTSTITTNAGAYIENDIQSGSVVSNYGVIVLSPNYSGGTVTANYGVYVGTQTVGATSNYAFYAAGTNDISKFVGSVETSSLTMNRVLTTFTMQNDPAIINNKFLKGVGTDGVAYTLIGLNTGDNVSITGKQGTSDLLLNPTTTNKGFSVRAAGKVGVLGVNPTALLHIGTNGTVSAANAPIKLTVAGSTLMTTPEAGAVETDANGALYWTPVSSRYQLATCLTGSATLDFGNTAAGTVTDMTLTVTGAALNDPVDVGIPNGSVPAAGSYSGWVSATNVVTIRYANNALVTAYDPASGTFKATVNKN